MATRFHQILPRTRPQDANLVLNITSSSFGWWLKSISAQDSDCVLKTFSRYKTTIFKTKAKCLGKAGQYSRLCESDHKITVHSPCPPSLAGGSIRRHSNTVIKPFEWTSAFSTIDQQSQDKYERRAWEEIVRHEWWMAVPNERIEDPTEVRPLEAQTFNTY